MHEKIVHSFMALCFSILPLFCLTTPVSAQLDAALVTDTIPSEMHPGETRRLSVTMQNTGSEVWTGTDFRLASQNTPADLWLYQSFVLEESDIINPGNQKTFTFYLKAPVTPDTYDSFWQIKGHPIAFFLVKLLQTAFLLTLRSPLNGMHHLLVTHFQRSFIPGNRDWFP